MSPIYTNTEGSVRGAVRRPPHGRRRAENDKIPRMPCSRCKKPRPSPRDATRCFCGGKITEEEVAKELTGLDKARAAIRTEKDVQQAKAVNYSSTFSRHIFEGEDDGNKHKGLHSMTRLLAKNDKNAYEMETIKTDTNTRTYTAWVKLKGKKERKASTFFPDTWREQDVLAAIEAAYKEYRVKKSAAKIMIDGHGMTWAAQVTHKGVTLWIGGLGDGDAQTGISTAFPAVDGSFADPNK